MMKFLVNININYPQTYRKLPKFFRICTTNVIFNSMFKGIKTKGFNSRHSVFLFPEDKKISSLSFYINLLSKKIDNELIVLNAIIVNNRLINIYKENFIDLFNNPNKSLLLFKFVLLNLLFSLEMLNKKNLFLLNIYLSKWKQIIQ